MKTKLRTFRIWTYDVWGNARDGYDVNDRSKWGTVTICCKEEKHNVGTAHEFSTFEPTDRQLSRAAKFSRVKWEWQDGGVFWAETKGGRPVGELVEES